MIEYGSISGVPKDIEVTVKTIINTEKTRYVRQLGLSSSVSSLWLIYKNLRLIMRRRISAAQACLEIALFGVELNKNDILDIKVIHFENDLTLGEFSAEAVITDTQEEDVGDLGLSLQAIVCVERQISGNAEIEQRIEAKMDDRQDFIGSIEQISNLTSMLTPQKEIIGVLQEQA